MSHRTYSIDALLLGVLQNGMTSSCVPHKMMPGESVLHTGPNGPKVQPKGFPWVSKWHRIPKVFLCFPTFLLRSHKFVSKNSIPRKTMDSPSPQGILRSLCEFPGLEAFHGWCDLFQVAEKTMKYRQIPRSQK